MKPFRYCLVSQRSGAKDHEILRIEFLAKRGYSFAWCRLVVRYTGKGRSVKLVHVVIEATDDAETNLLCHHGAELKETTCHRDAEGLHVDKAVWQLPGAGAIAMGMIAPTDQFAIEADEMPVRDRSLYRWLDDDEEDDWEELSVEESGEIDKSDDEPSRQH